jgi:predicted permease
MHDIFRAIRRAARAPRRAPGFTTAAVLALALGIGGSTVVFSVVNALLLRPLPYANPERLVVARPGPLWPIYEQWRTAGAVFEGLAAYNLRAANLDGAGEPERIMVARATGNFLSVVGVQPALGRAFAADELRTGQDNVVLLTDAFWRRRFGASRDVLGRTLVLDDRPYTVVGVLPHSFKTLLELVPARGLSFDWGAAVVAPLVSDPLRTRDANSTDRFWRGMEVVGRLRPGITIERARAETAAITSRVQVAPLPRREYTLVGLTDYVAGDLPAQMGLLAAAVGLLLLVACANVANLLLARGTSRRREMATRAAIGASMGHLVRHALTETLLLGLGGGLAGILAAWGGVRTIAAYGGDVLGGLAETRLDLPVLGFAAGLSLVVGLVVGLVPAIRLSRLAPAGALKVARGYAPDSAGRMAMSSALVVVEVIISLVLVVGAGLLARDFAGLVSIDLGFRSEGVLTADVSLSRVQYKTPAQKMSYFMDLVSRAAGLPGVQFAALSSVPPAGSSLMSTQVRVEGATRGVQGADAAGLSPDTDGFCQVAGGEFFRALSMRALEGRVLGAGDTSGTERVMVVNEAFARKYWATPRAALRHRVFLGDEPFVIVGVTADLRDPGSLQAPLPLIYFAHQQHSFGSSQMTLLLKGRGDAAALTGPLTRLVREINPSQPLYNVLTLHRIVATQFARRRMLMVMMGVFAMLALLLAAVGVYGVMAYSVAQRSHELGVRLALGGTRRDVFQMVVLRGMRLVGLGVVIGLPLAYGLTRVLASQLTGITRTDPPTYVGMTLLVTALGLLGCAAPAWRATRVDPIVTLRNE